MIFVYHHFQSMQTHIPLCFVHFVVFNVVYSIYICFDILSFVVVTLSTFSDAYVIKGHRGRDRMVVGFTLLPMQSVSITTNVASLIPTNGEMYWIQYYVIKFISDLRQVGGFLWELQHHPQIKLTATTIYN
jgi:hypothetical protein